MKVLLIGYTIKIPSKAKIYNEKVPAKLYIESGSWFI